MAAAFPETTTPLRPEADPLCEPLGGAGCWAGARGEAGGAASNVIISTETISRMRLSSIPAHNHNSAACQRFSNSAGSNFGFEIKTGKSATGCPKGASHERATKLEKHQEWREGSDPLTARQPGFAAKVPKSARRRERCGSKDASNGSSLHPVLPFPQRLRRRMARKSKAKTDRPAILASLGVLGLEDIEPAILAALVQEEPLLLVGPHGTGKSYLLNRLATALGLAQRHYNASLLNFDDLVGYPLPDANGGLRYIQTPSSIWGAQAVFFDEISRCRPDMQNKLFPIIHERRVQGVALEGLVHRWSAMNPPARDGEETEYAGSEPLDTALADRFAFVVEVPDWQGFTPALQEAVILNADRPLSGEAGSALKSLIASARGYLAVIRDSFGPQLAAYTRLACAAPPPSRHRSQRPPRRDAATQYRRCPRRARGGVARSRTVRFGSPGSLPLAASTRDGAARATA